MGARRLRIPVVLQVHDPARGRAAAAVLVLRRAPAAVPVLPPDPLEVVHLEREEGDDPEENLGARHVVQRIGSDLRAAMGRVAQPRRPEVLDEASAGRSSSHAGLRREPLRPEWFRYSRAPRPRPPVKRLISQISASTAAMMKS